MFGLNLRQERRQILHIDADAFFASVEQLVHPELANKPVLVGGSDGNRGIVAAASYEARKFGIKSAMPMYLAKQKCPQAIVVPGNFRLYREYSQKLKEIMQRFTPDVEMASIDEAYLDISGCFDGDDAKDFALKILWEINRQTGLSVSCGLASSKMVAKVASSMNKPHKFTAVPYGKEKEFLAPLALRALPGIGPTTAEYLSKLGFQKIEDLANLGLCDVLKVLGIRGVGLWKRAQGFDDSVVNNITNAPKSISKEHTFYDEVFSDENGINDCTKLLKSLLRKILYDLRSQDMKAGMVFIKIRYKGTAAKEDLRRQDRHALLTVSDHTPRKEKIFKDFSVQRVVETASSSDFYLFPIVKALFNSSVEKGRRIRLIGVGVGNLSRNYNLSLFKDQEKDDSLFHEIDKLGRRFGLEQVYC